MFIISEEDYLAHEGRSKKDGAPVGSGRYPLGSGEDPYQHEGGFRAIVSKMRKSGMAEKEVADYFGMSINQLRGTITISKEQEMARNIAQAKKYYDHGYSKTEIAKLMNTGEGNVRNWLKKSEEDFREVTKITADILKDEVSKKHYVDVGLGTEHWLGISREKLKASLNRLEAEGYQIMKPRIQQASTNNATIMDVLVEPGTTFGDLMKNKDKIQTVGEHYSEDGGKTWLGLEPITSIDSSRIMIRYAEDGGKEKDGCIELRPGVEDISLGNARYAQVRIGVDGTHYLKGMAMYTDSNMPKGIDIIFNTNKSKELNKMEVLKEMKRNKETGEIDIDNPFGASIKQRKYTDVNGKEKISALNIVNEEGEWNDWGRKLSSQFLSKQSKELARTQLGIAYDIKKDEYDEIMSYTNPTVRKKLLESFAEDCDSAAVHLKAAALPRQSTKVLIPLTDISDNEVYAPGYKNGERVCLVRFPHGGKFEIPELTVNNNVKSANRIIPNAIDAVGISSKVAQRLSGADFDGDTVLVIPNNDGKIKVSKALQQLESFDPSERYPAYPGMKKVGPESGFNKQTEMGKVSNLITDMTIGGASQAEIARAVKHSMVVIDAEKHNLDWRTSEKDNNIKELKEKYQGGANRGASTIISKASSEADVPEKKELFATWKMTPEQLTDYEAGKKVYVLTERTRRQKLVDTSKLTKEDIKDLNNGKKVYIINENTGKKKLIADPAKLTEEQLATINAGKSVYVDTDKPKLMKSTKMAETNDPWTLTSGGSKENPGNAMEAIYAEHATKLKELANQARKDMRTTESQKYNPTANKVYAEEVESLKAKLVIAQKNKPLERQAQTIANAIVAEKKRENPDMDRDEEKKKRTQAIAEARRRMGTTSKRERDIDITQREWDAIQAGAISHNMLVQILENTNMDKIKEYATPRQIKGMSSQKITKAKSLLRKGYSQADVADMLGVSVTTLNNNVTVDLYTNKKEA